ncbi:MAG: hypothetical protein HY860_06170 [Chlamydiales bacterium]|nr:hypothetical protein [Chlamydiales bacterium]
MRKDKDQLLIGDIEFQPYRFPQLDQIILELSQKKFPNLIQKQYTVSKQLYEVISGDDSKRFLLPAVVHFIEQIDIRNIVPSYNFSLFEFWLNQHANLSQEEQLKVRGKIMGKYIPRNDYQVVFPIGSGKTYHGTHFVTAHGSPDIDTIVSTFWGWVDAFASRVSSGFHTWNIPDGPPSSVVEIDLLFYQVFGPNVFHYLAKNRNTLAVTSMDLMTQSGVIQKLPHEFTFDIDHERSKTAVVVVDAEGSYLGDWRHMDVEGVRQVVNVFSICLRWIENDLHVHLISLFSLEKVTLNKISEEIDCLFSKKIIETEPAKEFTFRQQKQLQLFLEIVLQLPHGLEATFKDFLKMLEQKDIGDSVAFVKALEKLKSKELFDASHHLIENRPRIFSYLQQVFVKLSQLFLSVRNYIDTLDMSMQIKTKVFKHNPYFLSYRADIDEVKAKIDSYPYLTVNISDYEGELFPMGVIYASDLYQDKLGTVSLRDFCNREETKIPSYLEIISVIDHHKSSLHTLSAAQVTIADAQSSNVLAAKLSFAMHDSYSLGNMQEKEIDEQLERLKKEPLTSINGRIWQRLLQKKMIFSRLGEYFLSPERECLEYKHYLHAIFDDTDLLTKMTPLDVEVVKDLLNRLKSLQQCKEVEALDFDDISNDENFVKKASKRLVQSKELYSLYSKVYQKREQIIAQEIEKCVQSGQSNIFADSKVQNGCARVGQTKLFEKNIALFHQYADQIRQIWLSKSTQFHKEQSLVELYFHMVSTIAGAEDLYQGKTADYKHRDELWVYIPFAESATQLLKLFLTAFQTCPSLDLKNMEIEFLGDNANELMQIFKESFIEVPMKVVYQGLPMAIIYYKAGSMNSRKTQISPYLPGK